MSSSSRRLERPGEGTEDAARRELLEETGYEAKEMVFLAKGPISSGSSGEILTVYLARGLRFEGIGQRDETEDIEVLKVPVDEVYERLSRMEAEGNFIDLKIFDSWRWQRDRSSYLNPFPYQIYPVTDSKEQLLAPNILLTSSLKSATARLSSSFGSKILPYQRALSASIKPPVRKILIDSL